MGPDEQIDQEKDEAQKEQTQLLYQLQKPNEKAISTNEPISKNEDNLQEQKCQKTQLTAKSPVQKRQDSYDQITDHQDHEEVIISNLASDEEEEEPGRERYILKKQTSQVMRQSNAMKNAKIGANLLSKCRFQLALALPRKLVSTHLYPLLSEQTKRETALKAKLGANLLAKCRLQLAMALPQKLVITLLYPLLMEKPQKQLEK